MIGLAVIGAIVVFAWIVSRLSRRPTGRDTRWDDPGQSEAHAMSMLGRMIRGLPRP